MTNIDYSSQKLHKQHSIRPAVHRITHWHCHPSHHDCHNYHMTNIDYVLPSFSSPPPLLLLTFPLPPSLSLPLPPSPPPSPFILFSLPSSLLSHLSLPSLSHPLLPSPTSPLLPLSPLPPAMKKVKHRLVEKMNETTADSLGLSRAVLVNGRWTQFGTKPLSSILSHL